MAMNPTDQIYRRADNYLQIIHLVVITCVPEPDDTKEVFELKRKLVNTVFDELRRIPNYGNPGN